MHTSVYEDGLKTYTMHHNGDWSGDVILTDPWGVTLEFPFEALANLVGDQLKSERVSQIENLSGVEFLKEIS